MKSKNSSGFKEKIKNLFAPKKVKISSNYGAKLLELNKAIYTTSFGQDIYLSDIVKTAAHRIAEEISKAELRSVIRKANDKTVKYNDDDYNFIFQTEFNPLMTSRPFLYKLAWQLVKNCNAYIYQVYDEIDIKGSNLVKRVPREFWILDPSEVTIYDNGVEWRIEFTNGEVSIDMPYAEIIHIRWKFGENAFKGGNSSGKFDTRSLLGNLQKLHVVKECATKNMQTSLSTKGVITMNGVADADRREITREELENHLLNSQMGFLITDLESHFTPLNINVSDIPTNALNFIRDEVLYPYGVSIPILTGKFTDEEFSAFYQTVLEGIFKELAETFTVRLFTKKQLKEGYRIQVYDRFVQSLSFATRLKIVEMVNPSNLLNRSEQRELLGYEPDNGPDRVSLNYINASIADAYQLKQKTNSENEEGDT